MPIYEYKCEGCGEVFEVIQKFADEPLAVHDKCGGHVHRLMSAPSFQFKGTGWYVTDYAKGNASGPPKSESSKSEGKSDSGKSESSEKSESSGKSETVAKTEKKTESKPESKPAASSDKSNSD
ncbi:MAG: FmdB family zinc ribbon protein [Bryobacteraceae bacterium]